MQSWYVSMSTITLFDGCLIAESDGLPCFRFPGSVEGMGSGSGKRWHAAQPRRFGRDGEVGYGRVEVLGRGALDAPNRRGVYVIYDPRGRPAHVGGTTMRGDLAE